MLPWRLSESVGKLGEADYYNPRAYWLLDLQGLHSDHAMGVGHSASIYTRKAFHVVSGYPHISGAQDMVIDQRLEEHPGIKRARSSPLLPHEWYYIYRWGRIRYISRGERRTTNGMPK